MVVEIEVRVPDAEAGEDMTHLHDAALKLSRMTPTGTVELRETKTFLPIDPDTKEGGDNWPTYIIAAVCSEDSFDEHVVETMHAQLAQHIDVPEEVAIETSVPTRDIHLIG